VLREDDPIAQHVLNELRADPCNEFIDRHAQQMHALEMLAPRPSRDVLDEAKHWVYYPWRRTVVSILGPLGFRLARLDRNRYLVTAEEQSRLAGLRVGVVGLSAGHAIAHTLAAEGTCGYLRLADFDEIELPNLNRIPGGVFDLGLNKAVVAARRIAELDPYVGTEVLSLGVTPETIDAFLDGLDVVVEECDSLDIKVLLREAARARKIPVLMATSSRGQLDIERYDEEPQRPILHGLIGDLDTEELGRLSTQEKIPYVLNILDGTALTPRCAASLLEVDRTLRAWPQLAGDIWVGAAAATEAVRRIGLDRPLKSGRVRVDVASILDDPDMPTINTNADRRTIVSEPRGDLEPAGFADVIAAAAIRAPSGGNAQPWRVETTPESLILRLAPEYSSAVDIGFRGSAVAIGAALFNARVAAAAHSMLGVVTVDVDDSGSPLKATLQFGSGDDPSLAALYKPMLLRETNRREGTSEALETTVVGKLVTAASENGARLRSLHCRHDIDRVATILGSADRIRYLTSKLHAEMISELRWPDEGDPDTGIDIQSLELKPDELAVLNVIRRGEVMSEISQWGVGSALGEPAVKLVKASGALAVISVTGDSLTDYVRGGSAAEAVWVAAQDCGLAVHPMTPLFMYARNRIEVSELSAGFGEELDELRREFRDVLNLDPDEREILLVRLFHSPPASVRSRRRQTYRHLLDR
jgi:molybdopterin/thiamine biosynthesis adenylyltransferase